MGRFIRRIMRSQLMQKKKIDAREGRENLRLDQVWGRNEWCCSGCQDITAESK